MIILRIPKKREYREFILHYVKKARKNMKHKYIQLQADISYSQDYVYFIFPSRGLELAFALSITIKAEQHGIPYVLELSNPINLHNLPSEIKEAAKQWAEQKLKRKYYKLKDIEL